jgi:peptidoglycan/xylan/chitin deacetylase (PgdA/CDA1 family)
VRKRKIALVFVFALVVLALSGYWWNQHRHVSLRDAINPCYWVRRWRAEDLYDPGTRPLHHGNRSLKEVALTIDDGPHDKTTPALLDVLRGDHVRATFFVIGENVKKNPRLARRMVAEGHDVGNHTQSHLPLDTLTPRQMRNEISDCDINFNRVTGRHLALLRPPGMRYNKKVLRVARELGYIVVSDTWGAKDYARVTPDFIVRGTRRWVENGSILLFHDDYPATVAALPRIISDLKNDGYRFVTISEMLAHLPTPVAVAEQK